MMTRRRTWGPIIFKWVFMITRQIVSIKIIFTHALPCRKLKRKITAFFESTTMILGTQITIILRCITKLTTSNTILHSLVKEKQNNRCNNNKLNYGKPILWWGEMMPATRLNTNQISKTGNLKIILCRNLMNIKTKNKVEKPISKVNQCGDGNR